MGVEGLSYTRRINLICIISMVRAQNGELYSTLWNKITVTLKVLNMIHSLIIDNEPVQRVVDNFMTRKL